MGSGIGAQSLDAEAEYGTGDEKPDQPLARPGEWQGRESGESDEQEHECLNSLHGEKTYPGKLHGKAVRNGGFPIDDSNGTRVAVATARHGAADSSSAEKHRECRTHNVEVGQHWLVNKPKRSGCEGQREPDMLQQDKLFSPAQPSPEQCPNEERSGGNCGNEGCDRERASREKRAGDGNEQGRIKAGDAAATKGG